MAESKKPTLCLVDGSNYTYRAFFAIRDLSTSRGFPTNAVYGFNNMLVKLRRETAPEYLAVVFDSKGPTFRSEAYEKYKANRPAMPDALQPQIPVIKELVAAYAVPILEKEGIEADDIIGTLAKTYEQKGFRVVIVSGDKDLLQLVSDGVTMIDTMKDKTFDVTAVREKFGVGPDRVTDVMGLMGDASDNIPGVPGVGEKTASKLIREYGSVEAVLANADQIRNEKIRKALKEHADLARLSKELATVKTDAEIEFNLEEARLREPDREKLRRIFTEMEFSTLLQDFGAGPKVLRGVYAPVTTGEAFSAFLKRLGEAGSFTLGTESASGSAARAPIAGLTFCLEPGEACYIPLGNEVRGTSLEKKKVLEGLAPVLSDRRIGKFGHDLKTSILALAGEGIALRGLTLDTMVASYILNPIKKAHDLPDVAREFLGQEVLSLKEIAGGGTKAVRPGDVPAGHIAEYACRRADAVCRLTPVLDEKIRAEGFRDLFYEVEMPLVEVLAAMERRGVLVDVKFLQEMSLQFESVLSSSEGRIYSLAGERFNINSPKQLQVILFEKLGLPRGRRTKEGYSTDMEVLTNLAQTYELPAEILAYRSLAKIKSTYVDALPAMIDAETGRIHTSYNQTVTATGRLSSSDPNLQNIPIRTPEGRRIRQAFVAPRGSLIVSADYSQIELRVLAHLSGDRALLDIFESGDDVHTRTAATIFGVFPEMVTAEMRRQAKVINFGILYGMSPFGLSRELGISQAEAKQFIDDYFEKFRGVRVYLDAVLEQARKEGFVTTLLNRRRNLPEIRSANIAVRQFAERTAVNTPIQGTAADLIKIAMVNLARILERKKMKSAMIMQVHDELVFEVPLEEKEDAVSLIRKEMEEVITLRVPLRVGIAWGNNWDEAH
ncbi:MAG TPA: DNA polymerase I [Syntrophales bacterium]|nr:DNA polymerase I [Syntrophales bacterium]HPI56676.1 DNA polymerase I [Syntrophales bacterium]HPN24898.1 DNA polymerase I [Syntrophales bacterium]HQM29707.1 DNA polymerase I [Syntrophales bacterium]